MAVSCLNADELKLNLISDNFLSLLSYKTSWFYKHFHRDDRDQGKVEPPDDRGDRQFEEQHCCFEELFGGPGLAFPEH